MKTIDNATDTIADRFASLEIPGTTQPTETTEPAKSPKTRKAPKAAAEPTTEVNAEAYSNAGGLPAPKGKATRNPDGTTKNSLGLESTPEHLHISRIWQDKCQPLASVVNSINLLAPLKSDKLVSASAMVFDDEFRLAGMPLTPRGMQRASRLTGVPKPMIDYMLEHDDAKSLIPHLNREFSSASAAAPDKNYLVRMIKDGPKEEPRVRAIFSDSYAAINNTDALDMLCKALPGSDRSNVLVSHLDDGEEVLSGTLFLPDRMKTMPDSDYGVGIAFRNSEVGKSSYQVLPFLFRAVCLNGLIWGRMDQGIKVKQIHSGKIDMAALQAQVNHAVETALAHGTNLLNALQAIKEVEVSDAQKMIAMLSDRFDMNRQQAQAWETAFRVEPESNGFGILNGLTRAAQGFDGETRSALETAAGEMLMPSLEMDLRSIMSRWQRFEADAADVKQEQVVRLFAVR